MRPDQKPAPETEKANEPLPVHTILPFHQDNPLFALIWNVSPRLMYLKTWPPDGVSRGCVSSWGGKDTVLM